MTTPIKARLAALSKTAVTDRRRALIHRARDLDIPISTIAEECGVQPPAIYKQLAINPTPNQAPTQNPNPTQTTTQTPAARIETLGELKAFTPASVKESRREAIKDARTQGLAWAEIATLLEMTRQGVDTLLKTPTQAPSQAPTDAAHDKPTPESPTLPTKLVLSALNKDKITTQRTDAITRARAAGLTVPEIANHAGISETHTYRILQTTPTQDKTQTQAQDQAALIKELTATLQALDPYRITLLRRQAIYDARNPTTPDTAPDTAPLPWQEIADLLGMTRANCHVLYNQHLEGADFE